MWPLKCEELIPVSAPSLVAVTQMWWRRSEQTMRNSLWNGMNGVTAVVGSLVTYGLGSIHQTVLFKYEVT